MRGKIISYTEMCASEGQSLQRGMNYRIRGRTSVILMSLRKNSPYQDVVADNGTTIIYEGHDVPKNVDPNPKSIDQPYCLESGRLTENGLFKLEDAWLERDGTRKVFKFKLKILQGEIDSGVSKAGDQLSPGRLIPPAIKLEVFKRDAGECVICGEEDELHFDHIIPVTKGGTSSKAENIQLLCARHNIQKSNKIE